MYTYADCDIHRVMAVFISFTQHRKLNRLDYSLNQKLHLASVWFQNNVSSCQEDLFKDSSISYHLSLPARNIRYMYVVTLRRSPINTGLRLATADRARRRKDQSVWSRLSCTAEWGGPCRWEESCWRHARIHARARCNVWASSQRCPKKVHPL